MNQPTPKSLRLHIGIFGRRNVGKSSLLNAIVRQDVSIVSATAGTTTDPVEKPMELLPLGPVQFIDTAGIDDEGTLGDLRIGKTRQALDRTDLAILVTDNAELGPYERQLIDELEHRKTPALLVQNKADLCAYTNASAIAVSTHTGQGLDQLRAALLEKAPADFLNSTALVSDLVPPGELAILVVPIDKEAPKGRLILPQVQAIRDLLDGSCMCMVVKESELPAALARLNTPPALVVTDSQAFAEVSAIVPESIPLTGFSILMSRFKGDLAAQVRGAMAIDELQPGDRVLVAEACTHHPIGEDIGRVKIPKWLNRYVGGELAFTWAQGRDFPPDLADYKLVIHCGACMFNRREMLTRISRCQAAGVPVTNYGLTIAYSLNMLDRALRPFPDALDVFKRGAELTACP